MRQGSQEKLPSIFSQPEAIILPSEVSFATSLLETAIITFAAVKAPLRIHAPIMECTDEQSMNYLDFIAGSISV